MLAIESNLSFSLAFPIMSRVHYVVSSVLCIFSREGFMVYPYYRGRSRGADVSDFKNLTTLDFPRTATSDEIFIENERQFHLLLTISKPIQRSLGWCGIANSNVFYPDLTAILSDGELLHCEIEYTAGGFLRHGHSGRGCDLIISFTRNRHQAMIKGIPVWSFYLVSGGVYRWTLNDDIRKNGVIDDMDYGFRHDAISRDPENNY